MIEVVKAHNPLRTAIEAVGVHLERDKGLCPFHPDKHASLSVKGERWKCWSCGEGGDVIDFTAKYYGLDTKGALRLLADRAGIKKQTPADTRQAEAARRAREELLRAFRAWEQGQVNYLSTMLRVFRSMEGKASTEAQLQSLAELHAEFDALEYRYEVFCSKDDTARRVLFQEEIKRGTHVNAA